LHDSFANCDFYSQFAKPHCLEKAVITWVEYGSSGQRHLAAASSKEQKYISNQICDSVSRW